MTCELALVRVPSSSNKEDYLKLVVNASNHVNLDIKLISAEFLFIILRWQAIHENTLLIVSKQA